MIHLCKQKDKVKIGGIYVTVAGRGSLLRIFMREVTIVTEIEIEVWTCTDV